MYSNRREAGRQLAAKLTHYARRPDALVLGVSRGGIAVAHEVAQQLGLPLDLFLVRKLMAPDQKLVSLGAVASGGIRVLDHAVIEETGLSAREIAAIDRRARDEIHRLEAFYRDDREPLQLHDRVVLLVDDGITSGATMLAAVACLRTRQPRSVVVGTPVGSKEACGRLSRETDEVVCVETPERYHGIPQWYDDFRPISAEETRELLQHEHASS